MPVLVVLLLLPLAGALLAWLTGRSSPKDARVAALVATIADLACAAALLSMPESGSLRTQLSWIPSFGVHFCLAVDGLSLVLIFLTTFLGVLAVIISWKEITEKPVAFYIWLLVLQTGILLVFLARDLMLFYFGWELMLIPMFFLIGIWGHEDKHRSAFKFFLFTFTGSVFMLVSFLYVYLKHLQQTGIPSFLLDDLLKTNLTWREEWWVFLGMALGFAVKVPLFPLHTWLPDAHTQAPTAGSLILAGLLLKTGVYGFMRLAIPLAPHAVTAFAPVMITLGVIGVFYGAIAAFPQRDFKRLVAYSSISHLGFVIVGLFCGYADVPLSTGFQGSVLQMMNHGFATGALFMMAGIIQERTETRNFDMFGGMWQQVPRMGAFLLFFSFASLGIPGTGSFVGELYIINGAFAYRWWLGAVTCFGILFAAIYSLRIFTATMQGPAGPLKRHMEDTSARENLALACMALALVVVGFYPAAVTRPLSMSASQTRLHSRDHSAGIFKAAPRPPEAIAPAQPPAPGGKTR